jgi:hypothetical protein
VLTTRLSYSRALNVYKNKDAVALRRILWNKKVMQQFFSLECLQFDFLSFWDQVGFFRTGYEAATVICRSTYDLCLAVILFLKIN